jgi:cytochrome c553
MLKYYSTIISFRFNGSILMRAVIPSMLFGFLCLVSSHAMAVEKITIHLDFIPDIDNGRSTFGICARCHLPEAWGNDDGTYPQLAGQHVNVLMKQLLDIRNGTRHSSLMFPFVQQRTVGGYQELSNVVAYISTLPMNPSHARGPWRKRSDKYKQGKIIYQKNCSTCHGENGQGDNERVYPKLQGQHFQYMSQQLKKIKNGLRGVDPTMQAIVQNLDFEQLEQAVNYASYFTVPKKDMATSRAWRNPDFK